MSEIIQVRGLSKSYLLNHEGKERYTALRDVITEKTKKIFSFSGWKITQSTTEKFWALKDIDFDIEQGDRVGIIGRNGAGKSTLLKILSRITEPTKGSIKIKGRIASLLEVGTGFHPELTGRENIFLNGAILGMSRVEIKKHFDDIVEFAEVNRFLDTPVKRYSSGMYVRLAFAVAAHLEPEILIVDEVLAVGDAQFQKKCLGKMEDVSKNEGRTVLFVSHNMGVVSQLCKKGILLSKGQLKISGDMKKVIESYLINEDSKNIYSVENSTKKQNYVSHIEVLDSKGKTCTAFQFKEEILLKFSFVVKEKGMGMQVGIGLEDKFNTRVFTILKEIDFFKKNGDEFSGLVKLPAGLIAPNYYSFVVALWTTDGRVYDVVSNVCPVTIHDDGTELALYEGAEYGNIIIQPVWENY